MSYAGLRYQWPRVGAVVAAVVGVVFLTAGWFGVSNSSLTTEQIPYLASGAVGGLFALGVAATLWLSADLRDQFEKLVEIHQWLLGDGAAEPAAHDWQATSSEIEASTEFEADFEPAYAAAAARPRPLAPAAEDHG